MKITLDAIREHLAKAYGLDAGTVDILLQSGVESVRQFWGELVAADTPAGVASAAHALKGTLRGMGLDDLGQATEELEHCARSGGTCDATHPLQATLAAGLSGLLE